MAAAGADAVVLHAAVRAGEFIITHKSYMHGFRQGWHEHPVGGVDFVLAGGGAGVYGGQEVVSQPGSLEYYGAGVRHRFEAAEGGIRTMHVVASPEVAGAAGIGAGVVAAQLDASPGVGVAWAIAEELLSGARDQLLLESLAMALLDEIGARAAGPCDAGGWLAQLRELLLEAPEQAESLAAISAQLQLHPSHVARQFRRAEGVTIGEYGRRVRLARAARQLAGRSSPGLAAVALEQGFADQAHFSRAFKALYGCTPGAFRRRFRGG